MNEVVKLSYAALIVNTSSTQTRLVPRLIAMQHGHSGKTHREPTIKEAIYTAAVHKEAINTSSTIQCFQLEALHRPFAQ